MGIMETKIYGAWVAKQTARGVGATVAIKRARQVSGNLRVNRADGRERFGVSDRWGDAAFFVDSLSGEGDPGIQAQPGVLAYLLYLFAGQESVTGAADPYTHTITPAAAGQFWQTWFKRVGVNDVELMKHNDCKTSQIVIEGSTGQKVVRITPSILSCDPGEKIAAEPAKAFDPDDPFIYTEGESAFQINASVVRAQSQFQITLNENLEPVYTDSPVPLDLVAGEPEATIALTLALNTESLAIYNREVYNDTNPAAGTKPVKSLPATGAYSFLLTKSANRTFQFDMPNIKWTPDVAVEPNPSGGLTEVSLAGELKRSGATAPWTAIVKNGDAAYV